MPLPLVALVVEDDPLQRETLVAFLRDEMLDVIECETSEAAELVLAGAGPDVSLLITDHALAGDGTGLELARFAKRKFPRMTVVLVSGLPNLGSADDIYFFQKPFDPRHLVTLARSA